MKGFFKKFWEEYGKYQWEAIKTVFWLFVISLFLYFCIRGLV